MPKIGIGRYGEQLRRLLDIAGEDPGFAARELAPDLNAVLILGNDRPEWQYLANEFLVMGTAERLASAGNLSSVQIENPATSGVLGTIEAVLIGSPDTLRVHGGIAGTQITGGTALVTTLARDSRLGTGQGFGALNLRTGLAAASQIANENFNLHMGGNDAKYLPFSMVLAPGGEYVFETDSVNERIFVTYWWRERAAPPTERRPS